MLAVVALEVEHDAALVAVDAAEVAAVRLLFVALDERARVARHVAARRLDLHHVGPEIGEQHGAVRPGEDLGEVEHAQAVERTHRCAPGVAAVRVSAHRDAQWLRRFSSTRRSPSKTLVSSCL